MRHFRFPLPCRRDKCHRSHLAFTLPEVMMAMTIVVILLGGAVASHLFGLRLMEIIGAKGSASAEARRNLAALISDVCSAKMVVVGDGSLSSFSEAGMDVLQKGSTLQIYPSLDTNVFTRYFLDAEDEMLKRMTNGAVNAVVVASGITYGEVFSLEDFAGNILSNSQNNCAVGLTLQFHQIQSARVPVGPASLYTSYQVRTRIAQRSL